ncbi:MAG: single-stranded DNA-binding protein [Niastella sp.]|nr:single-stranded DNA-binding protein [Niastella sp.]
MSTLRNRVQLIGCLRENPKILTSAKSRKLARICLVTTETHNNSDGKQVTETQWHTLIAWGKLADLTENYLFEGREIAVEGKLTNRSYTDKQGNKRYQSEVVVSEIILLRITS